jgi:hypothetical protein
MWLRACARAAVDGAGRRRCAGRTEGAREVGGVAPHAGARDDELPQLAKGTEREGRYSEPYCERPRARIPSLLDRCLELLSLFLPIQFHLVGLLELL